MSAANQEEILELLGEVDDLIVERLMDTGASLDEIGEALDDLQDERRFAEERHVGSSERVLAVRAILEELLDDAVDDYDGRMVPMQSA